MSRMTDTKMLISWAWPASGAPGIVARVGTASAATARTRSTAIERTAGASNRCVPWRRPPRRNASPSTSRELARIEPMSAVWTTTTRPGLEAEDRDEQLGQVAQGRLEDARRARSEPMAELVRALADDAGQAGQGDGD